MWIFTRQGFFSVTAGRDADTVQIRARRREHLQRLIAGAPCLLDASTRIIETKESDYRFRIIIADWEWLSLAEIIAKTPSVYRNFKGAVHEDVRRGVTEIAYLDALHDVWSRMYALQPGSNQQLGRPSSLAGVKSADPLDLQEAKRRFASAAAFLANAKRTPEERSNFARAAAQARWARAKQLKAEHNQGSQEPPSKEDHASE